MDLSTRCKENHQNTLSFEPEQTYTNWTNMTPKPYKISSNTMRRRFMNPNTVNLSMDRPGSLVKSTCVCNHSAAINLSMWRRKFE